MIYLIFILSTTSICFCNLDSHFRFKLFHQKSNLNYISQLIVVYFKKMSSFYSRHWMYNFFLKFRYGNLKIVGKRGLTLNGHKIRFKTILNRTAKLISKQNTYVSFCWSCLTRLRWPNKLAHYQTCTPVKMSLSNETFFSSFGSGIQKLSSNIKLN